MNLKIFILIFVCIFTTIVEYKLTKRWFTPSALLGWPFVIVILMINIIGEKYKFYSISVHTIDQIIIGIIFFSIGSIFANIIKKGNKIKFYKLSRFNGDLDSRINIIVNYTYVVATITLIRLAIYMNKYGVDNFIATDGAEGVLMSGIFSHLLLSVYPLTAIITSYAIRKKKYSYLVPVILIIGLVYFTFVKYHLIVLVLIIIIYLNIENPKMFYRTIPVLIIAPVIIFIVNYLSKFNASGVQVKEGYIFNHLINYLSGGLIYNSVNPNFVYNNYGITEIVIMMFMVIPNLFTNLLFGFKYYSYEPLPFVSMGLNGESGNVLNTISFLFTSREFIATCFIIMIWGFILGLLYTKVKINYSLLATVYSFTLLSFYATFYVLTPPWEMIIFSIIMPRLFIKKVIIKF